MAKNESFSIKWERKENGLVSKSPDTLYALHIQKDSSYQKFVAIAIPNIPTGMKIPSSVRIGFFETEPLAKVAVRNWWLGILKERKRRKDN